MTHRYLHGIIYLLIPFLFQQSLYSRPGKKKMLFSPVYDCVHQNSVIKYIEWQLQGQIEVSIIQI